MLRELLKTASLLCSDALETKIYMQYWSFHYLTVCLVSVAALGGYLLAIADEDGCVKLLDTRKNGQKSLIKGLSLRDECMCYCSS